MYAHSEQFDFIGLCYCRVAREGPLLFQFPFKFAMCMDLGATMGEVQRDSRRGRDGNLRLRTRFRQELCGLREVHAGAEKGDAGRTEGGRKMVFIWLEIQNVE